MGGPFHLVTWLLVGVGSQVTGKPPGRFMCVGQAGPETLLPLVRMEVVPSLVLSLSEVM